MYLKLVEFLSKEVPSSVSEIRESLDLLASCIESAIDQVADKANLYFKNRDFKKVPELSENSEELNKISKEIQDLILNIDKIMDESDIEEVGEQIEYNLEKDVPNYSDYLVDREVEHSLYEDFTHKRPCAFKIEEEKISVKDWKDALVKTMEYLTLKNAEIIKLFPDDPKMNGKKVIYFSRVALPTMRAPRKLESLNMYIETNLSANSIRNVITRALNKYDIRLNNYKIYLKADYSDLHR